MVIVMGILMCNLMGIFMRLFMGILMGFFIVILMGILMGILLWWWKFWWKFWWEFWWEFCWEFDGNFDDGFNGMALWQFWLSLVYPGVWHWMFSPCLILLSVHLVVMKAHWKFCLGCLYISKVKFDDNIVCLKLRVFFTR